MKVLIVDDKSENLYLLESILKGSGYIAVSANNGAEALALARKDIPDLIITDILMPVMDGFTLCREIKKDEKLCNVPFIFYTATYSDPRDEEFALNLGADRFILKPQDPEEFIANVKELLKEVKKINTPTAEAPSIPEIVILKEYNQTLVRKLEDKMLKLEQSEKEIKKNNILLIKEIEERKHTEELLRKSEERFKEVSESLHEWIWEVDNNGLYTFVSPILEELLGYKAKEVIGIKYFYDFFDPEIKEDIKQAALEAFASKVSFKEFINCNIHKDGRKIILSTSGSPILDKENNLIGYRGVDVDITERKQIEMKLQESELRFRKLFENAKIGLYRTTPSGKILMANNELVKMFGYSSFEVLASRNVEIGGFGSSYPRKDFIEMIEKNGEVINFESEWIRLDGTAFFVRENAHVIRDANGNVLYYDGVVEDITEIRKTEIVLRESEQNYRTLADSGQALIWTAGTDKLCYYFNKVWLDFTGRTFEQEVGNGWVEGVHPDDCNNCFDVYVNAFDRREKFSMVYRLRRNDGIYRWILDDGCPRYNSKGEFIGYIGHCLDISERKLAEEENTILAHSLKSINECVSITDMNDKILFVNKAFLDIYGYDESELIGKHISILRSKNNTQEHVAEILPAIKLGEWKGELLNQRKDGSEFPISLSTSIIYDKDSVPLGLIGVASDITAQKQMVDELLKLSSAVEQSPASIIITDIKGNIEYANPKVFETTGFQFSELLGKNPRIFGSGEKSAIDYKVLWDTISSGEEWRGEFHNKKKNGELYWESASISTIKNNQGEITHYLAVKEDITEKKKVDDALIRAKEKAEEMNHLKTNFLANMSHELRTPLVGILGYSDLISQENVSPEIRAMAETIHKSGNRLSETLNLILDLSRFETEKKDIKFQKVELVEITKNILNLFSAAVQKKGLSLTTSFSSESILINFDKRAYSSILNNLVNNAVKYTNEGRVTINLSLYDHEVELKVTDTGIGIAKNDFESIFDEFRQVSQGYSRNFEGTGLGLSITKKFVEKYGGTISVDSKVGKGSTFKVLLPVKMDAEIAKEPTVSTKSVEPELLTPLGLLVDDDPLVFQFMSRYLKDYVALETTFNAEIAFKLLKEKKYDIIFMDINLMHGIDGKKAASMIRKMERYAHTPIIATTAYVMLGDKEEFISAGCSHYLPKPFNKKEIIEVAKEALKL